jgi:NADP-dependent 3-hydroxy acid dehydrogenase YdfG
VTPSIKEKGAVVTGASSGIGSAIALELGMQGTSVCLVGRDESALEEVAARVRARGSAPMTHACDLTQDGAVQSLVDRIGRRFGPIGILVHSAGGISLGPLETASSHDFDSQFAVNVRVVHLLNQALLPQLIANQGEIVIINSSVGLRARPNAGLFASTQHALKALADSLRDEINSRGVRVLSVYPGRTATPRQERIFSLEDRPYHPDELLQPQDIAAIVVQALTLPRTAEVTDIMIRPMKNFAQQEAQEP